MKHHYLVKDNQGYDYLSRKILSSFIKDDNLIIFINGNMGVGKTSLCSSFARVYDVYDLCSSSFGLVNTRVGLRNIIHADLYRSVLTEEFFGNEILPLLDKPFLLLMEWVNPQLISKQAVHLSISITLAPNYDRKLEVSLM